MKVTFHDFKDTAKGYDYNIQKKYARGFKILNKIQFYLIVIKYSFIIIKATIIGRLKMSHLIENQSNHSVWNTPSLSVRL